MSAYEVAAATIRQEHRALAVVMDMLQCLVSDVEKQHAEPDFALFAAALYYIDDFSERCHHPKEDEYFFRALRRNAVALNAVLDDLEAEHVCSARMNGYLQRALVHYVGGAPSGFERFKAAVDAYAGMLRHHMEKEEKLFEQARDCLSEQEWQCIAAAFDANDDPLFGDNRREEFRRLYLRIINQLPRRLRLQLQRRDREQ